MDPEPSESVDEKERSASTAYRIGQFAPLAIVAMIHFAILAASEVNGTIVGGMPTSVASFVIFPIHCTLIATWLALQATFWRRVPYAFAFSSIAIAWYVNRHGTASSEIAVMIVFHLLAALALFALVRQSIGYLDVPTRNRFGLRDLLVWTTSIAIAIAAMSPMASTLYRSMVDVVPLDLAFLLFFLMIVVQYAVVATLLVLGTVRKQLWPFFGILAAIAFAHNMINDPWLTSLITGWEMFWDWEALLYSALQQGLLLATILAWRHSGLMLPAQARSTSK